MLIFIIIIVILIICFHNYVNKKRRSVVLQYSPAIKSLEEINSKFNFIAIPNFDMKHNYDNQAFYQDISPKDYLTYQLVYKASAIKLAIKDAKENNNLYQTYQTQIANCCKLNDFTFDKSKDENLFLKIERLLKIDYILKKECLISTEKEVFNSLIKKPTTNFSINVTLWQTDIQGKPITHKSATFDTQTIELILTKLSNKKDGFYLDDGVWQSICRVERGRVSNKMRFAIYERDGHRCRKCKRRNVTLEIDHIFPISKGGKSEYDNLQTLCHDCNVAKSNTVEPGAVNPRGKSQGAKVECDVCGAPMILKKGRYGEFYGCSNYPSCRFTKQK